MTIQNYDSTLNLVKERLEQIDNIAVLSCDPCLHNSQHFGFRSYADGFVKEGAGAGGAIIASLLKTENSIENLFTLFEQEYKRISTWQSLILLNF